MEINPNAAPAAGTIFHTAATGTETSGSAHGLSVRFSGLKGFSGTGFDLVILPFTQDGLPSELDIWLSRHYPKQYRDIPAATNKFESAAAAIGPLVLENIRTPIQTLPPPTLDELLNRAREAQNGRAQSLSLLDARPALVTDMERRTNSLSPFLAPLAQSGIPVSLTILLRDEEGPAASRAFEPILHGVATRLGFQPAIIGRWPGTGPTPDQPDLDEAPGHGDDDRSGNGGGRDQGPRQTDRDEQTRPHFLADHATDNDLLGFYPYAAGIAAFVRDRRTVLPLTVAIDGAWGTGKSSLMKMLRKELDPGYPPEGDSVPRQGQLMALLVALRQLIGLPFERAQRAIVDFFVRTALKNAGLAPEPEDRKYITVFVNAWRHGKGTQLKANLVNEVLQALAHRLGPDFLLRLELRRLNRLGLIASLVRGLLTNALVFPVILIVSAVVLAGLWYGIDVPMLPKAWREFTEGQKGIATAGLAAFNILLYAWKNKPDLKLDAYLQAPDYLKLAGDDAQVEGDFRRILMALEEMDLHLALFVDDLDRCSPAECAAVVEALNTFFGTERNRCLFVLGMHREMVAESLEVAYEKLVNKIKPNALLAEQQPFGRRFLEKIVQFFVALPEAGPEATEDFLNALTSDSRQANLEEIKRLSRATAREKEQAAGETSEGLSTSRKILRGARKFLVHLPGGGTADFMLETSDRILAELEKKGIDTDTAMAEAEELSSLKERIEERRNANENQHVAVFKQVRGVLRANPRQYKRFFNKLRFFRLIGAGRETDLLEDAVMAALALERPEEFYRLVKAHGGVRALCRTPDGGAPGKAAAQFRADMTKQPGLADLARLFEELEKRYGARPPAAPQQQAAE